MNDLFAGETPPLGVAHQHIMLASATDLDGFRAHARALLAQQVPPEAVSWHCRDARTADLFGALNLPAAAHTSPGTTPKPAHATPSPAASAVQATPAVPAPASDAPAPSQRVPAGFLELCQSVILHSDPQRFGLLYRLLWRLAHEPGLRHDPLDADRMQAGHLAQAVRRDTHKMKAFVRFRTVQDGIFRTHPEGGLLHVAWFEPEHHIVEAITPFFARRFTQMRWAILTPERCVEWDGAQARFSPGANKADAPPADAGEQLWLTYYQSIFNPARLKLKMMQKEMPRKYWQNLPEAQFISSLAASAHERRLGMIEEAPQAPKRRIPMAKVSSEAAQRAASASAALLGGSVHDLGTLGQRLQSCRNCPIGEHATQAVPGEGPLGARVMVVGEQPGDQEDLLGRPFVGPAGQLFNRALADLGLPRSAFFVTNAVKHFKFTPDGRHRMHKTPSPHEAAVCAPWLETEISIVKPGALLALGATAASTLLRRQVAVMSERGQWFTRPDGLRVLVTLHPAALLRTAPAARDAAYAAWLQDLRLALVGA